METEISIASRDCEADGELPHSAPVRATNAGIAGCVNNLTSIRRAIACFSGPSRVARMSTTSSSSFSVDCTVASSTAA